MSEHKSLIMASIFHGLRGVDSISRQIKIPPKKTSHHYFPVSNSFPFYNKLPAHSLCIKYNCFPARQNGDFGRNSVYFPPKMVPHSISVILMQNLGRKTKSMIPPSAIFPPTCLRILPIFCHVPPIFCLTFRSFCSSHQQI